MKKTFLNLALFLALGFVMAALNSCDRGNGSDDGELKIVASNVTNSSAKIKTVGAEVGYDENDEWFYEIIAQAPYQGNGFVLKLPANDMPDKCLFLISTGAPEWISISDKNVKVYVLEEIEAYDEAENNIGSFYLEEETENSYSWVSWLYADRNATIKGTTNETDDDGDVEITEHDWNFKKGWNVVYFTESETYDNSTETYTYKYSSTSQKPANFSASWYYYDYNLFYSNQEKAKSAEKTNSFLQKPNERRKIN